MVRDQQIVGPIPVLSDSLLLSRNVFAYALYSSLTLNPYLPVRTASSTLAEKELTKG